MHDGMSGVVKAKADLVVQAEPEGTVSAWLEAVCPACGTGIQVEFPHQRILHTSGASETNLAGGQTTLAPGPITTQCSLETCHRVVQLGFLC